MPTPARPPLYLVDDDEAVLDSLRFMLESCDERQLRCFADGERFLEEVDLRLPACLILDCRMPGLSGPEVQQRLKAAQSPIAILFLTGHGEVPLAVESLKQGAVDFLQKPVQLAPLLAAIARAEQATLAAAARLAHRHAFERLTPRERSVIEAQVPTAPLAWMRAEDLFFMQIQGSGYLTLEDGRRVRAAYAADNGRPFTGIARPATLEVSCGVSWICELRRVCV